MRIKEESMVKYGVAEQELEIEKTAGRYTDIHGKKPKPGKDKKKDTK